MEWLIYIPDEGHWPINYNGTDKAEARRVYLKWADRKRLPAGSFICSPDENVKEKKKKS